jgi:hypothetical protein
MKPLPHTPGLLAAARRIVWFKPPEEALDSPIELMAYAMKHATDRDMALLLHHIGMDGLREAIDNAPAGIIDARSWSYWNAKIGAVSRTAGTAAPAGVDPTHTVLERPKSPRLMRATRGL